MELITGENDEGRRLDRILRKALPFYPLPFIHRLLRQKKVLVNRKPAKAQDRLTCGDVITILSLDKQTDNFPSNILIKNRQESKNLQSLQILWEGRGLLAVNKKQGIEVHGNDSLETAVGSFLYDRLPRSLSFKPGPLHRLDRMSSGIVVFSSSLEGARLFSSLMREKKIIKTYYAITGGRIEKDTLWQDELVRDKERKKTFVCPDNENGKSAVTKVTPLAVNENYSFIKAQIITGRTHQIRAQAAFHGHPLLGDTKYGGKKLSGREKTRGFFLHAHKISFLEYSIEAPLPDNFRQVITSLFGITDYKTFQT